MVAAAVQWAERIMQKIDAQRPTSVSNRGKREMKLRSRTMNAVAVQYFDERGGFWRVGYLEKLTASGHGCALW